MKRFAILMFLPLALSACGGSQYLENEELRQMKPACAGGDTAVCADIGHRVRQERAESAYLASNQE